jgi:PAS domain S-box-containing protein
MLYLHVVFGKGTPTMSNESAHNNSLEASITHLSRAQRDPLFAALWTSHVGVCLIDLEPASPTIVAANAACHQHSGHNQDTLMGVSLETLLIMSQTPAADTLNTADMHQHTELSTKLSTNNDSSSNNANHDDSNTYTLDDLDDFDQLALFDEDLFDETVSGRSASSANRLDANRLDANRLNTDAASSNPQHPAHLASSSEQDILDITHNLADLAQDPSRQWRAYVGHRDGRLLTAQVSCSTTAAAAPLVTLLVQLEPTVDSNSYTRALGHFIQNSPLHHDQTADTPQQLVDTLQQSLEHLPLQLQQVALYLLTQPRAITYPSDTAAHPATHPAAHPATHPMSSLGPNKINAKINPEINAEDIHWTVWSPSEAPVGSPLLNQENNYNSHYDDYYDGISGNINIHTLRQQLAYHPASHETLHNETLHSEVITSEVITGEVVPDDTLAGEHATARERYYVPLIYPASKGKQTAKHLGSLVIEVASVPVLETERQVLYDVLRSIASQFAQMLEQQQSHHHFEARLAAKTDELDLKAEQLAYLHALIDSTSDFVCLMDANGSLNYVNPAGQQLVGDASDTDITLSASVFVTLNAKNTLASHFAEALQTGSWHGETNFTHADGRSFPVSQVLMPLYNQHGELAGFGTIARDIGQYKALEHALRSSESKMRALLEAIPDLIFVFDKQGHYLDVAGRSDGMSLVAEDLVGYSLFDVLPEDLANRLFAAIHEVLMSGHMQQLEYQIGSDTVSEAQLVKMSEGRVLMVVRDITTRKRTEQDLRVFQSLVEAAADGIILIDDGGIVRYSNPAYDNLVDIADPCGQHVTQMLSRNGKKTFEQAIEAMLQVGTWQGNIEYQNHSGEVRISHMSSFAIRDDKDNFTQAGAIVRDIGREYEAERQLQAYKQLLESLLEHLPAGVCVINYSDDTYLLVNQSFAAQAGYTPAELIGKRQADMFDTKVVSKWHQRNQRIASSRQVISFEEQIPDDHDNPRYYFTSEFPLIDTDNEVYAIGVVTSDISNIKQAEHTLRQRNDLLTLLHGLSRNLNSAKTYVDMLTSVCDMLAGLNVMAANLFIIDLDESDNPLYSTKMAAWHQNGGVHGKPIGTRMYLPDYPNMQTTLERPDATNIKHLHDLDADTRARWQRGGISTLAVLPVAPSGLWLGQVILYWQEQHTFTDSERELLNTLPDILAPVVANRHLLASLEQTVHERTRELQESQALLQGFMNHTPAVMWVKDLDSKFIVANENLAQMYGVDSTNIRGKSDFDVYAPEVAREFVRIEHEIAQSKQARILEESTPLAAGTRYWLTTKFPILDAHGDTQAIGGFSFDITDTKHAEQELQAAREQFARAETELNITKRIQELLLPSSQELDAIHDLDIAGVMQPAEQVGGDYFDVLSYDNGVMLSIGDVTDHGLESGLLMLMTQTAVRTLLTAGIHDSSDFFEILNQALYDNLERMRADKSLTLLRLDYYHTPDAQGNHLSHNMRVSGQHEHLIVVDANGIVSRIDTLALGMPLGLERTVRRYVAEQQVQLEPGGGVVLYTDGITEAENAERNQYGLNRLCEIISQHWQHSPEQLCQTILQDVSEHVAGHTIYDDITLLVAKRQLPSS